MNWSGTSRCCSASTGGHSTIGEPWARSPGRPDEEEAMPARRLTPLSVALAVGLTGAGTASAHLAVRPAAPRAPGNVNVSRESGNQAEDAVAIQQTNPNNVVVVANEGSACVAQGASVTGVGQVGAFGAAEVPSSGDKTGDYGDVAIGPNGQVVISYQDPTGGEGPATVYEAKDPDGLGPMPMGPATQVLVSNVGGFDYIPAQAGRSVDIEIKLEYDRTGGVHNGRLYLLWTQETPNESNNTDVMVQHSDDDGATWSTAVKVNDDIGTTSQFN